MLVHVHVSHERHDSYISDLQETRRDETWRSDCDKCTSAVLTCCCVNSCTRRCRRWWSGRTWPRRCSRCRCTITTSASCTTLRCRPAGPSVRALAVARTLLNRGLTCIQCTCMYYLQGAMAWSRSRRRQRRWRWARGRACRLSSISRRARRAPGTWTTRRARSAASSAATGSRWSSRSSGCSRAQSTRAPPDRSALPAPWPSRAHRRPLLTSPRPMARRPTRRAKAPDSTRPTASSSGPQAQACLHTCAMPVRMSCSAVYCNCK